MRVTEGKIKYTISDATDNVRRKTVSPLDNSTFKFLQFLELLVSR